MMASENLCRLMQVASIQGGKSVGVGVGAGVREQIESKGKENVLAVLWAQWNER